MIVAFDGFQSHFSVDAGDYLIGGHDMLRPPAVTVPYVHVFDVADDMARALKMAGQVNDGVVVDVFLNDTVDFQWRKTDFGSGLYRFEDPFRGEAAAVHGLEDLVVQAV